MPSRCRPIGCKTAWNFSPRWIATWTRAGSRDYVERPDPLQRCQIVADKLLTGIMNNNETTAQFMAAYILTRMPGVIGVDVDTSGEIQNTQVLYA